MSFAAGLPPWGRLTGRVLLDEHASLRHGGKWGYASSHAFGNANKQNFAMIDVVITRIPTSFRLFQAVPKFERGWAMAFQLLSHGKPTRTLSLSLLGTRPHTRISRVQVALPTFSPGCPPIGRNDGGLGWGWRFLRRPDNTVARGWGNLSPKAESKEGLVLV